MPFSHQRDQRFAFSPGNREYTAGAGAADRLDSRRHLGHAPGGLCAELLAETHSLRRAVCNRRAHADGVTFDLMSDAASYELAILQRIQVALDAASRVLAQFTPG